MEWTRSPLASRLARATLAAALGLAVGSCDTNPIRPPVVTNSVVWTRITDPARIAEPSRPDWRGGTIAFEYRDAAGHFRLAHMNEDGSGAVLYTDPAASDDHSPSWVAGGLLVYSSNKAAPGTGNYDLWYSDLAAGTVRRLTAFPEAEWDPAPRPGRPMLAYAEGADPLGGRITLIPDTAAAIPARDYLTPDTLLAGEPSWDPAGARVCFSAVDPDGSRHIWVLTLAGTSVTSSVRLTTGAIHDSSPRFSPDGKKIVFASDRTGRSGVWWVSGTGEASGLNLISFEDQGAVILSPSWSPDGLRIVLSSNGRGGRAIWVLSNLDL